MKEKDRIKGIHAAEQAIAHLVDTFVPAVWSVFNAYKKQGFTEEQAMALSIDFQKTFIETTKS